TAIKNAIIEVRNGDSDISDYTLFQQALYDLSGIETASEELKAKLDELNAQQGRIDALGAELSALEIQIASTDAENATLGININQAAVRLDNLYLEIKEEAAHQENLKDDIDALREEIENKEGALSAQYANELAAAKSALNAADVAYDIALSKKAQTQEKVRALLGESALTEYLATAGIEDALLSELVSQNQQDALQSLKDTLSTYLADNEQTLTDALSRMPRDFSPNVYNHNGSYSDLLTLFDGRGSFVTGYTDHFTATLESLLAPSVSPDFLTSYPTQLGDYLEAVNTAISAEDNTVFSALLQQGQTLLTGMEALTDALLAMPEQLLTPEEAAQRFDARHPDNEANLAALSAAKPAHQMALEAEQTTREEAESHLYANRYGVHYGGGYATDFDPSQRVDIANEANTAMRALYAYYFDGTNANSANQLQGYNTHFEQEVTARLSALIDLTGRDLSAERQQLVALMNSKDLDDARLEQGLALSRSWIEMLSSLDTVLETLPHDFLTLEDAQTRRDNNVGNTYTDSYVYMNVFYYTSQFTTQQALDATLAQVRDDADYLRGVGAGVLDDIREVYQHLQAVEEAREATAIAQAEVDRLDALIPDVTVEQAYEKTVATTVNWSKQLLSKLLPSARVDAEFALIDIKLAHTRAQHVYDNALAEKERTTLAVHAYAEPSVITEYLPHLTHYITLKNDHYGSTVWKATKTPQQAESALTFLSNVKSQLDELYAQASEEQTKGELQAALALADEMVVAIEADQSALTALESASAAIVALVGTDTVAHTVDVMRRAQDGTADVGVMLAQVRYDQAVEEKAQTKAVVRGYTSFYRVTEYLPQHDYTLHHSGYNDPIFHATESDTSALRANSFLTGIQNELRALHNDTEDEAKQLGITEAMSLVDDVMAAITEDRAARSRESVAQTELAHAKALASDVAEYLETSPEMPAFGVLSGLLSHLVNHQGAIADVVSDRGASALATDLGNENGLLWQATQSETKGRQALALLETASTSLNDRINAIDLRATEDSDTFETLSAEKTHHLNGVALLSALTDALNTDLAARVTVSHTQATKTQTQATLDDVNTRYQHFTTQLANNAFCSTVP
ncbi:hypothetical protein, partial [Enterovibrio norvegicus]|uniref:hypothetical protein n=1 Tax=Enterovibrio norvegicus TaxID=188144 RepID=UPI000594B5B2